MSYKVLVIPEDPVQNGYVLKPLLERILEETGRVNARVKVLDNPRLRGYAHARKALEEVLPDRYDFWDLWVFVPDADAASGLAELEERMQREYNIPLICCAAAPELEAWLLAGHREKLSISWSQVRAHTRLKEEVFDPFLKEHGDSRRAGGGRDLLMRETLRNYRSLLELCPEIGQLERKIREILH